MRFIGIIVIILWWNSIESVAQKYNAESEPALVYIRNLRDTTLATGFYRIYPMFNEEDWTYKVRYTQTQKVVDVKRRFPIFRKSQPMRYIYSTAGSEVDSGKNFVRKYGKFDHDFKVDPLPVAVRQNVVKADTFRIKINDSTFFYRVNVHLNFIADSTLCINGENKKKCLLVGMIINNQLVEITNVYYKQYNGSFYRKYLVFEFYKKNVQQIEKYLEAIVQDKYN